MEELLLNLTPNPGDSVKIWHSIYNRFSVVCCGEWTHWEEMRFEGPTLTDTLLAALKIRQKGWHGHQAGQIKAARAPRTKRIR